MPTSDSTLSTPFEAPFAFAPNRYFIKVDFSGIQSFVFRVQSERAARTIKGRSYFVLHTLAILEQLLLDAQLGIDPATVQRGGGTLYCMSERALDLEVLRQRIHATCSQESFLVYISCVELRAESYGANRKRLEAQNQRDKLAAFRHDQPAFMPFSYQPMGREWTLYSKQLLQVGAEAPIATTNRGGIGVDQRHARIFDYQVDLTRPTASPLKTINQSIPVWRRALLDKYHSYLESYVRTTAEAQMPRSGDIIEFNHLAYFAGERTGTEKLGVLKMDVDGLGTVFNAIESREQALGLSTNLKSFFEVRLLDMLEKRTFSFWSFSEDTQQYELLHTSFKEHIYVVFAGGDDCYLIGGWDAVFQFAEVLHEQFMNHRAEFDRYLPKELCPLTLSAGLLLVGPKFPAIRFTKMVEAALKQAKAIPGKNRISVFGQLLTWKAFGQAAALSRTLARMVLTTADGVGEPKEILHRIQQSVVGYEHLEQRSKGGDLQAPEVWRLNYYLARSSKRRTQQAQEAVSTMLNEYANGLIKAFVSGESTNYMRFPVAARWAEFQTKI